MLHSTHRLLLVAFLGALALFATTVTPALFATVPPPVAARVVGATGRSGRAAMVLGGVLALLAASSLFLVTPEIARLRHAAGDTLSHLPPGDPIRRRFGTLHGISTVLFGLQAVVAV